MEGRGVESGDWRVQFKDSDDGSGGSVAHRSAQLEFHQLVINSSLPGILSMAAQE